MNHELNLNFLQRERDELIQISITERKSNGLGVLFIDMNNSDKANCSYIPLASETFPQEMRNTIIERYEKNPPSVLYFCFHKETECQLIELDLDTRNDKTSQSIEK